MKRTFLILGALIAALFANAQQKWTLQQCVDTALANNRNIKQRELQRQNNEITYNQARLNLLPDLNASASHGFSWGRALDDNNTYTNSSSLIQSSNFGIGSSIVLFDGLKMKYNIDARMSDLKNSEAELDKIKHDIILNVSTVFLQVLLNKELLILANNQLELTKNKIEQQQKLVETGKLAEGEMYELYAQQSKEELNRIHADNTLRLSLLDLAQIIELKDFENIDVIIPEDLFNTGLQVLDVNSVYQSALINRPEVKSAEYMLESREKNVQIAKSAYFPSLSFNASLGSGYYNQRGIPVPSFNQQISDKISAGIGFSLQVPIFNKMAIKNQVASSKLEVESSKINLENTKIDLRKTVQQAYYNAIAAKSKWDSAIKSENASREAFRFANQKYENGRATVYELYQAKNSLSQAESEVIQSKYEYVFRLKILELLM